MENYYETEVILLLNKKNNFNQIIKQLILPRVQILFCQSYLCFKPLRPIYIAF